METLLQKLAVSHIATPQVNTNDTGNQHFPLNDAEMRLAQLWAGVLKQNRHCITRNDHFFELGGGSLKAANLLFRIQREFQVTLSLHDIYSRPTLLSMAAKIEEEIDKLRNSECMVLLNMAGRDADNIFLIHDGSGDIQGYTALAGNLQHFNCWGVRCQTLLEYGPQNRELRELAHEYVRLIKLRQPVGPYYIGGWSLGGTIAYEVVRQLEEDGDRVEVCVMIDCQFPDENNRNLFQPVPAFTLEDDKQMITGFFNYTSSFLENANTLEALWELTVVVLNEYQVDREKIESLIPLHIRQLIPHFTRLDSEEIVRYMNTIRTLERAINNYKPFGRLSARLIYIKAAESEWDINSYRDYCIDEMNIAILNGTHFTLMQPPYVQALAGFIQAALSKNTSEMIA